MAILPTLSLLATLLVPATDLPQSACPPETEAARRIVTAFRTAPDHAGTRAALGITASGEPVLLHGQESEAACGRLQAAVRSMRPDDEATPGRLTPTFYTADGHYYAVLVRELPSRPAPAGHVMVRLGFTPLVILDRDLNVRARLAM